MKSDTAQQPAARWKPHRDWRTWAVILMLAAMLVYIFTLDEAMNPAAPGQPTSMRADAE